MFERFLGNGKPKEENITPVVEDMQEDVATGKEQAEEQTSGFVKDMMNQEHVSAKEAKSPRAKKVAIALIVLASMAASSAGCAGISRNNSAELQAFFKYHLARAQTAGELSRNEYQMELLARQKKSEVRAYQAILDHEKNGTALPPILGSYKSDKRFGPDYESFLRIIRMYERNRNSEMIRAYILKGISDELRAYMEKKGYTLP